MYYELNYFAYRKRWISFSKNILKIKRQNVSLALSEFSQEWSRRVYR